MADKLIFTFTLCNGRPRNNMGGKYKKKKEKEEWEEDKIE